MTSAIILAGGLGTRLRSVVPDLPKPMAPIAGRPFLEYQLDYWIAQGVSRFLLSVGYRHEVIVDHFGNSYKGADIDYVIEQTPLGTGGGLLLAVEKIGSDEPFLLLNGDTYFAVDLKSLTEFAMANDADWCFSLFRANEEGRYMGMDVGSQGQIISLKSGTGQSGRLANGGVYLVQPRALAGGKFTAGEMVSLEDDIFQVAVAAGQRFFGMEFTGSFIDIGVPHDYHLAPTLLVA
jgi:D-glycero-alpha-D-manno-heptose 1-phosphate guanylyltransferase